MTRNDLFHGLGGRARDRTHLRRTLRVGAARAEARDNGDAPATRRRHRRRGITQVRVASAQRALGSFAVEEQNRFVPQLSNSVIELAQHVAGVIADCD